MLINLEEQQEIVKKYQDLTKKLEKWQNELQQTVDSDYAKGFGNNYKSWMECEKIIDKIKSILNG